MQKYMSDLQKKFVEPTFQNQTGLITKECFLESFLVAVIFLFFTTKFESRELMEKKK